LNHDGRPQYSTPTDGDDALAIAEGTLGFLEPIQTRVIREARGEGRPLFLEPGSKGYLELVGRQLAAVEEALKGGIMIDEVDQVLAVDLIGTPKEVALPRTCGRASGGEQEHNAGTHPGSSLAAR